MPLTTDDEPTVAQSEAMEESGPDAAHAPPAPSPVPALANTRSFSEALTTPVEPVGPPCEMCGAPAGGNRFCVDCDPPPDTREQTARFVAATPPPLPIDPPLELGRPRMRRAVIVLVLVLVVAGVAAAVVLLTTREKSAAAGSDTTAGGAATRTMPTPADDSPPRSTTSGTAPGDGATPDPVADGNDGAGSAGIATGPEDAMREHMEAVDGGDLSVAYGRFSSRYRKRLGFEDWSAGIRGADANIEIVEVREIGSTDDRATVRVILATRDRGAEGDPSRCHIFRGRVDVVRERGKWLYDPPGLRETRKGGIDPSSDERCEPLFR